MYQCVRSHPQGAVLAVRVQPRAKRSGCLGLYGEREEFLKWGVHAVPEDGKANKELLAELSKQFCVPVSSLAILQGETSRLKQVLFLNVSLDELAKKIAVVLL